MRVSSLAGAIALSSVLSLPGVATAVDVNLKGGSSFATGSATIDIDDVGSCNEGISVDVEFTPTKRKFTATDNEDRTFKGKYKQSGKDDRKITFKFTSSSKKKLEKAVKALIQDCLDTDNVKDVDLDDTKITGKVNKSFTNLKLKIRADVEGKADGEKGEGKYKLNADGALNLAPE